MIRTIKSNCRPGSCEGDKNYTSQLLEKGLTITSMRKILSLLCVNLLFFYSCMIQGNESKPLTYNIDYSADDEVCVPFNKLINQDIKNHSRVLYEKHEDFVKWTPVAENYQSQLPPDPISVAYIDIDNDGKKENLVRLRGWLSSQITENIKIFRHDIAGMLDELKGQEKTKHKTFEWLVKIYKLDGELVTFNSDVHYPLKKAKNFKGYYWEDRLYQSPSYHGGIVLLNIYKYQGQQYLAIDPYLLVDGLWFLLVKYKGSNNYEDVCYFELTK